MASGFAEQDVVINHYGLGREALYVGLSPDALTGLQAIRNTGLQPVHGLLMQGVNA